MTARANRRKPPVRGVPRRRVPGGSRFRSATVQIITKTSSETEQEDEDTEKE
ncbi:hypothetical protein [Brunnivagina elsteri]|uniref:hypothetical protein n=1 Tax=Brunnivagina elsteri TaxID=1247191 RepID=UPI0013045079|nr:hypothetical protein [Calothrix elsteri]